MSEKKTFPKILKEFPPEGSRRLTGGGNSATDPDPEISAVAKRRKFSAVFKLRVLEEADRCIQKGELGALLRREGLYYATLQQWRKQREAHNLSGLAHKKGGRIPNPAEKALVRKLKTENERLKKKLAQAEQIIEIQKKISLLLGTDQNDGISL